MAAAGAALASTRLIPTSTAARTISKLPASTSTCQTQCLQSGILDGIIGGRVVGTYYSLILMANIMNGTPLAEEKALIQDRFVELASCEDALIWDEYGKPGNIYSAEETRNMVQSKPA